MIIPDDIVRHVSEGMALNQARMTINSFGDRGEGGENPCLVILVNPAAMAYWAEAFGEAGIVFKAKMQEAEAAQRFEEAADFRDKKNAVLAFFEEIQKAALNKGKHLS